MMQAQLFFDKDDRKQDMPLHKYILEFLVKRGIAGATMFEGVAGFGQNDYIQRPTQLFSFIDEDEKVKSALTELRKLTNIGLFIAHPVSVWPAAK
jgi:PII-like signaling protein